MARQAFISVLVLLLGIGFTSSSSTLEIRDDSEAVDDSALSAAVSNIKGAMLASIRTSWEQGTALGAIIESDAPEYSVFANSPFSQHGLPGPALRLALSAAVRQTPDGRLSQQINDALDGAALDGASAGSGVTLGTFTDPSRKKFWQKAADAELNFILHKAPRTSTGAISHRTDSKQYWADGVYMGFPFMAYYGAVTHNRDLLAQAYTQCKLYRDALLVPGPTGHLWAHIRNDTGEFVDPGIWATGNAWAALGILRVQVTLMKSPFASSFHSEIANLKSWVKEILDGTFRALNHNNLVPDYITGGPSFGDSSASAALASVAFRSATIDNKMFGSFYTNTATKIMNGIVRNLDNLGIMNSVVDPLQWSQVGILSTEGQAFGVMMIASYQDWVKSG